MTNTIVDKILQVSADDRQMRMQAFGGSYDEIFQVEVHGGGQVVVGEIGECERDEASRGEQCCSELHQTTRAAKHVYHSRTGNFTYRTVIYKF